MIVVLSRTSDISRTRSHRRKRADRPICRLDDAVKATHFSAVVYYRPRVVTSVIIDSLARRFAAAGFCCSVALALLLLSRLSE